MSEPIIAVKNLIKTFSGKRVLDDISFEVKKGEIFSVMGCSGGGKSTLLRHIIGSIKPDSGNILVQQKDITQMGEQELDHMRKKIGMVFQDAALLDYLSVEENVALPLREHTRLAEEIIMIIVRMKLSLVGLRGFERYSPAELSGGMKKRVGIARAIALDPEVVFYDEPTSGLDPVVAAVINKLIMDLSKKLGITSVVVTHDMHSVLTISDTILMIHQGRILQMGTPEEIRNTKDPVVKQFITGSYEGPIDFFQNPEIYVDDIVWGEK